MSGAPGTPRRVVVTGIGAVTPIGLGVEGLWSGLHRRRSAISATEPVVATTSIESTRLMS